MSDVDLMEAAIYTLSPSDQLELRRRLMMVWTVTADDIINNTTKDELHKALAALGLLGDRRLAHPYAHPR